MSIFKTIASKIKRVVSLKNLTNAVTGNFTAIGSDVVRVMASQAPTKNNVVSTEPISKNFAIPVEVNDVLIAKGEQYKQAVSSKIAENPTVQGVYDVFTMSYIKATWLKHRPVIIGAVFFICGSVIAWKMFKKPSAKRGTRRR